MTFRRYNIENKPIGIDYAVTHHQDFTMTNNPSNENPNCPTEDRILSQISTQDVCLEFDDHEHKYIILYYL